MYYSFICIICIQNTVLNMVAQPNIATIGKCVESTLLTFCRLIKWNELIHCNCGSNYGFTILNYDSTGFSFCCTKISTYSWQLKAFLFLLINIRLKPVMDFTLFVLYSHKTNRNTCTIYSFTIYRNSQFINPDLIAKISFNRLLRSSFGGAGGGRDINYTFTICLKSTILSFN